MALFQEFDERIDLNFNFAFEGESDNKLRLVIPDGKHGRHPPSGLDTGASGGSQAQFWETMTPMTPFEHFDFPSFGGGLDQTLAAPFHGTEARYSAHLDSLEMPFESRYNNFLNMQGLRLSVDTTAMGTDSLMSPVSPGPKIHQCGNCPRAFSRRQDLKRHCDIHLRTHKRYACERCHTAFTRSDALSRHVKAKRCHK